MPNRSDGLHVLALVMHYLQVLTAKKLHSNLHVGLVLINNNFWKTFMLFKHTSPNTGTSLTCGGGWRCILSNAFIPH